MCSQATRRRSRLRRSESTSTATTRGSSFSPRSNAPMPVTQRRVGADFFRQLAHEYRARHPSRHGDLHWIGEAFPAWLASRMAGTGYEWLADLARLEWACEESAPQRICEPAGLESLGRFDADVAAAPGADAATFVAARGVAVSDLERMAGQPGRRYGAPPSISMRAPSIAWSRASLTAWRCTGSTRPITDCCSTCATACRSRAPPTQPRRMPRHSAACWAGLFGEGLVVQVVSPSAPA